MLTDDPGTPGNGMWEINFVSALLRGRNGQVFEANADLNYGLGDHIQLKFEAPWLVMKEAGEKSKSGPGNSMLGVKWRFIDEERKGFDMSIYPQLEFNNPTRSVERGLADRGLQFFVPVEASKNLGPVEVNAEVGYRVVQHGSDEWEYGFVVARRISRRIELMGELHGSALPTMRQDELFLNAGTRLVLSNHAALLFSAGRTVRISGDQGPQFIAAFGVQFTFRNRMPGALKHD